jgi:hypothetical protein
MIVNRENHPILWCGGQESEHKLYYKSYSKEYSKFAWIDAIDHQDKNIFYIEFFGYGAFEKYKVETVVPNYTLEKVRNKEIFLLLHCSGHGPHHIPEEIYKNVVVDSNIPVSQIILSTESVDMYDAVLQAASDFNLPPLYTQWTTEFEHKQMMYSHTQKLNQFDSIDKNFSKKYLCLNGNFWHHRTATVWLLKCFNLINDGFVSMNIKNPDNDIENTFIHLTSTIGDEDVIKLYNDNKDTLLNFKQLKVDECYDKGENIAELLPVHNNYFTESYFSLVTETNFPLMRHAHELPNYRHQVGRLLSEKIFRTILYKHPFIVVGCPNFLKVLKFLGYKTFEDIIDESYDTEVNNGTRLLKVIKEVKRLCDMNDNERTEFFNKCKAICDYNFEVLTNKNNFVYQLNNLTI